jgi:hypothetical protein
MDVNVRFTNAADTGGKEKTSGEIGEGSGLREKTFGAPIIGENATPSRDEKSCTSRMPKSSNPAAALQNENPDMHETDGNVKRIEPRRTMARKIDDADVLCVEVSPTGAVKPDRLMICEIDPISGTRVVEAVTPTIRVAANKP